jgi:heptosyltransferase-2
LNTTDIKNILIVRLSSLGDILLSTPLVRSLNKTGDTKIDFILREEYCDLLRLNPYINKLFLYKKENVLSKTNLSYLKGKNYDLIIDLQNNLRSAALINKLKGIKLKFNKRILDKLLLVNLKINRLVDAPQIPERYSDTIKGFNLDDEGLDLITDKNHSEKINPGDEYIGFAPGAKHFTKRWPQEYFIELGRKLTSAGFSIILLGGKDDRNLCAGISANIPRSIDLSNNNAILQTAADIKMCRAVVCNDSGLMHTACAVKVPVLSFFGSSVREFGFTPYKNKNLILENKYLSCRPCSHIGRAYCPKGHFKCMLEITPETAFDNLNLLLNSK